MYSTPQTYILHNLQVYLVHVFNTTYILHNLQVYLVHVFNTTNIYFAQLTGLFSSCIQHHNSQGQFCSFHRFILALNIFHDVTLFNSVGFISQIFGPRYRRDSCPKVVVRTLFVLKMLFDEYNNVSLRRKM